MNFEDYKKKNAKLFAQFADLIRRLIKETMQKRKDFPKLQSSKNRGKDIKSLQMKLADRRIPSSANIEKKIKDLAGVRLIFYTNTDVNHFIHSGLIPEMFKVHWEESQIHYPTTENEQERYQGIHYTVSLSSKFVKLPKYKKFSKLRCEIQIQSVLNNAWSDTYHAVGYKIPRSAGFGRKIREEMDKRMWKIMDDFLIPAGFDFQKVQKDYDHYMRGKVLYDQNPLEMLKKCTDNDQRYELLSEYFEYVIRHLDNIRDEYSSILNGLESSIYLARKTRPKPIKLESIRFNGRTSKDIISIVLKIIEAFLYLDPERNFKILIRIYESEDDSGIQKLILDVIGRLVEYNIEVCKQVGLGVQEILANIIENFTPEETKTLGPVILTVWRELLKPDMESSLFFYNEMTISFNALPVFDGLITIRKKAIHGLMTLLDEATSEKNQQQIISALWGATRTPSYKNYTNDFLRMTLENTNQITDLLVERIRHLSYEIFEIVEQNLLYAYRRAKQIAEVKDNKLKCKKQAKNLIESILRLRDIMNIDIQYGRYKTLIGFEGIFSQQWNDEKFDVKVNKYRQKKSFLFIDEISETNENEWVSLMQRCAQTESEDLATFPIFEEFLINLSKAKPNFAFRLIEEANMPIMRFLPLILTGLSKSKAVNKYKNLIKDYIKRKENLHSIALHHLKVGNPAIKTVKMNLDAAIKANEPLPVIITIAFVIKNHNFLKVSFLNEIFVPAIKFLTKLKETRWVRETWYMPEMKIFFESTSVVNAKLILDNLKFSQKISSHEEAILRHIAVNFPKLVLTFFQRRIEKKKENDVNYEAIPFELYELGKELGKDTNLLIRVLRKWDQRDKYRFGRFLKALFPKFNIELGKSLIKVMSNSSSDTYDFVIVLLQNYCGEPPTHEAIKELIHRLSIHNNRVAKINNCLNNAGVVSGEFGYVEAYREKISQISPWLEDTRPKVKNFAKKYIRQLKQNIANSQRTAEMSIEIRKRDYGIKEEK